MRRPAALYDIRHLLTAQLPHLPGRLRAALALWVEGTLLGVHGCQDTVTLALAHGLRGARNPHTLRRRQRELLYDDADRIDSWGAGQELEVERCFAPLLQWVRSWWVPTGGRAPAQEPLVLAVDPRPEQLCWMSSLQRGRMVFDPGFLGLDHGIENDEQFAHGRDEGDLFGFADCAQAPVKRADHRVVAGGGQGGHVQGCAHVCAASPHSALASELATVAVERGHAHEGQDLRIQRICLGQLAGSAGEIAHLARVSHDDGMASCAQGHGHLGLQAAGGFQHNLRGRGRRQADTQLGQACGIIRHPPYGILTGDSHIQVLLRHIDSYKKLWLGHEMVLRYAGNKLFSGPALQMRILDPGNCTGSGKTRA